MADQPAPPAPPDKTADAAAPSGKASWPKTAAGTIDWEIVFEHPETGLLAEIARAQTPQELRERAITIIKQLFARKGDEEEAAQLSNELAELITDDMPADRLALVHYAVGATFRQIKTFRQKKAAEYALAKASKGAAAPERRTAAQSKQSIKEALARKKQRRARAIGLSTAATILVAAIGAGAYFYLRGPALPPRADQILLQQMQSAAAGGAARTHVYGGALQTRRYFGDISVIAENIPVEACISVAVELAKSGTFTVNGKPLAYGSTEAARAICQSATPPIRVTWIPAQ